MAAVVVWLLLMLCLSPSICNAQCTGTSDCPDDASCIGSTCVCNPGYSGDGTTNCQDIDECTASSDNCDPNADCLNTPGSFTCTCRAGYSGNGISCSDIDECTVSPDDCDDNADCLNTPGSFTCTCRAGFTDINMDGKNCVDIDECSASSDDCDPNADCLNTPGSFTCTCRAGFTGNGKTCTDTDECSASPDNCDVNADCLNTPGSFTCTCRAGYSGNGISCSDIDECTASSDDCDDNAACLNTPGSFTCTCGAGFTGDGKTCIDIDECSASSDDCDDNADCLNTPGSFTCTCRDGFTGNGKTCTACIQGQFGMNCLSQCSCVDGATCNNVNGDCTCMEPFPGAVCDKKDLDVSLTLAGGDRVVMDTVNQDNVTLMCNVNLLPVDLDVSGVRVTYPDTSESPPLNPNTQNPGLYELPLLDVHQSNAGQYICTARTQPTTSVLSDTAYYTLRIMDVDECSDASLNNCDALATCTNTPGNFECECITGYEGDGSTGTCQDVDECGDPSLNMCDADATCMNTVGSYICVCNAGFTGSGYADDCTECIATKYGVNCAEDCTCVAPVDGQNDVVCRNTDGFCTCNNTEFTGKNCDKRNLTVFLEPSPNPVLDTSADDSITWRCKVNLHSRDLTVPVTITYPNDVVPSTTKTAEGLYEATLDYVTPSNNGNYTCSTSAGIQEVTDNFILDVLIVGRIIEVSPPAEGKAGDTVEITCTVYISPGASITWHLSPTNSDPIRDDGKYTITQTTDGQFELTSSLQVSQLISSDGRKYLCNATEDTREVEIIFIEPPRIADIGVSTLAHDELRVNWTVTFLGNVASPSCNVEYRKLITDSWTEAAGSPVNDVEHTITGLDPYTEYYVQVVCINKVGPSNTLTDGPQRTLKTNPSKPQNLAYDVVQPKSFVVTWDEPAMKNGPIDFYRVSVSRTADGSDISSNEVTGLSTPVAFLTAFTNYTAEVTAFNTERGQNLGSPAAQEIFRTAEDAPTPPVNVQSIDLPDTCEISWDSPRIENGIIRSYTVIYNAHPRSASDNTTIDHSSSGSYDITDGNQRTFTFNKSIQAAYSEYQFNISATTMSTGGPSEPGNGSCITPPAAPKKDSVPPPVEGSPSDPEEEAITSSTFYVKLTSADQRNGPISCYEIIVKELLEGEDIDKMDPDGDFPPNKVGTYGDSQDKPGKVYVAFVESGSKVASDVNIKIGAERVTRCGAVGSSRRRRQAVYDHTGNNGRLSSETRYTTFVRAFVKVGEGMEEVYTSSPFMQPVMTTPGTNVAVIVIVVILVILITVVLVLGALIYMKRRKQIPLLHEGENGVAMVPVMDKEPEVTHMVVLPIAVEDLSEKVRLKTDNDDDIFKAEFKTIPEATGDVTRNATNLECNKEKNRYINIGAYDTTRVRLAQIEDVEGSDYINACYVDGYEKPRKFIAAQGPREDTVLDFWRMIWEQNCATIIMLTKCLENGREKCAEYWPEEDAIMYDDIVVTLDDVVTCADYVIRKFTMQKHIETDEDEDAEPIIGETRTLMQFHFLGWPDFGIPKYPHSMLCFVKRIRHMTGTRIEPGNIVVHCSAGVGRTGTYILIDSMLDMIKKEKRVDIYNVIYKLRNQRNLLVQSLVQYIFIHRALMEEYLYGHTEVDVGSFHMYNQKLCAKKSDTEIMAVETEYRTVASLPVDNTDQKTGNIEANKQKNRIRQVIPYDRNRVKLERLTGQEHSNYINASFIDGYEHKKAYIAAQGPLPNTMGDFWRTVWENQCSTIIMLTECEERGQNVCTQYWPESGDSLNPAFLVVSVKASKEEEECTIRDLEVSTTKGTGTKIIRQFHYHGWPEVGVPESSASLVKVIGLAHEHQQDIGRFPILVHCSAGSGRTGVFIALSYLLQRAKAEGIVDVFQSVRALRQQRPLMVQDVAQYQFCYRAMMEYLDSFDHYANFK